MWWWRRWERKRRSRGRRRVGVDEGEREGNEERRSRKQKDRDGFSGGGGEEDRKRKNSEGYRWGKRWKGKKDGWETLKIRLGVVVKGLKKRRESEVR